MRFLAFGKPEKEGGGAINVGGIGLPTGFEFAGLDEGDTSDFGQKDIEYGW
jgi:hypothetical protein